MIELNQIYHGDCQDLLLKIPDKSIDLILCDLPYGTTQNKWDSIIPLKELWQEYERLTKDDSPIVLTSSQPFTAKLVLSNIDLFKYEWIWQKTDSTNYLNAKHQPLRIHESILVFYKKAKYYPQGLRRFEKLIKDSKKRTTENYGETKGEQYKQEFTNYPESILIFESENNTIHPTQKPVDLFRYLIRTYSDRGGIVLDNCIGSGTTAIACLQEGRNFIGIEKNKEYYDSAVNRIEQYKSQLKLF